MLENSLQYFLNAPFWELTAVLLSVAYVVLVARNNSWCWPAAFVSTLIFTIIFYDVSLLMESLLNIYYMAMAIYGWYRWQNSHFLTAENSLPVITWPWQRHLLIIVSMSLLSLALGWFMDNYTQADFAYLDTFTTVFAVMTTYLVTIKLLENWLYWIIINSVSAYLYLQKGLEPTALLALFNIVMCFIGIYKWYKDYQQQQQQQQLPTPIEAG
ncbi:nicotinamide riboside transporter PnuC [Thalassotalea sp. HSM 43]|uniref:nicotinamide riboside transporter PnuC n=1 Tax=Thalassotalea sp. HSM 43 TaxID=2552945 RepID=UPI001081B3EF|nr:nicotinamide riboside transporter PnuC [Thalassotalea sp. HSM 43]QBY06073.1 nicotinamide riboside transporter PnuC [Thalassotalea sp. HSM 43]